MQKGTTTLATAQQRGTVNCSFQTPSDSLFALLPIEDGYVRSVSKQPLDHFISIRIYF